MGLPSRFLRTFRFTRVSLEVVVNPLMNMSEEKSNVCGWYAHYWYLSHSSMGGC